MTTAKEYLDILREREPQLWKEPLKESGFTEKDLSDIEKGLGYKLPERYCHDIRRTEKDQILWQQHGKFCETGGYCRQGDRTEVYAASGFKGIISDLSPG
jgi:hypothetical protein